MKRIVLGVGIALLAATLFLLLYTHHLLIKAPGEANSFTEFLMTLASQIIRFFIPA